MAFIPLVSHGRVIGKFMLYYDVPHKFAAEELQLAGLIAAQVAFAVERSTRRGDCCDAAKRGCALRSRRKAPGSKPRKKPAVSRTNSSPCSRTSCARRSTRSSAGCRCFRPERAPTGTSAPGIRRHRPQRAAPDAADRGHPRRVAHHHREARNRARAGRVAAGPRLARQRRAADGNGQAIVELVATIPDDLPRIEGDPKRLHQVLGNVLSNAIKFTPDGGRVEISARSMAITSRSP